MNIRDLMTRLESIEQLDEFRLKDVQAAVGQNPDANARAKIIANLAVQNKLPGLYDPVDGHYVDNTGSRTFFPPSKDVDMQLGPMGLIPPNSQSSSMIGSLTGVSGDKYDQQIRNQSAKFNTDEDHREFNQEHIAKLGQLVDQLKTAKPDPVTATTTGDTTTGSTTTGSTTTSQDANTAPQINLAFNPEVKKMQDAILQKDPNALPKYHADGKLGQETIGAMQKYPDIAKQFKVQEGIKVDIAKSLVESFGYDAQLDEEYSAKQLGTDVDAGIRGLANGVTFGYADNIAAGVNSAFGKDTYKQALEKQMAATANAKAKSSQFDMANPLHNSWTEKHLGMDKTMTISPYTTGEFAGTAFAPIPGGALANAGGRVLAKAAPTALKGAANAVGRETTQLGTNFLTSLAANVTKNIGDISAIGLTQDHVNRLAKMAPEKMSTLQSRLGVPVTGQLDPATVRAYAQAAPKQESQSFNQPLSESEKMASFRDMVKMLEASATSVATKDLETGATKNIVKKISGKDVAKDIAGASDDAILNGISKDANKSVSNTSKSGVKDSGNSTNTISNNTNVNVNASTVIPPGGLVQMTVTDLQKALTKERNAGIKLGKSQGLATMTEKEVQATASLAKEVEKQAPKEAENLVTAATTQGKTGLAGWWERNKGRVKWGAGVLAAIALLRIGSEFIGGNNDNNNNNNNNNNNTVVPVDGKCPPGYQLSQDGKTCVKVSQEPNPAQKPTCSLAQMDLVKQIKAEMAALTKENQGGDGNVADPAVAQALQRAQEVMDAALASCTPPSGAEQAANPAPKDPRITGTVNLPGRDLKSGTVFAGDPSNGTVAESDELARWLKIARG